MKLGFRTAGFENCEILSALRAIREAGYDCAEICLEHRDLRPETLEDTGALAVRDALAGMDLESASVSYHGDNDPLELRVQNTFRATEIASLFPSGILIINCERASTEIESGTQFRTVLKRMTEFGTYASDLGVVLAVEAEPGLVISDSADVQRLVQEADCPALKVNLDIGHAYITDTSVQDSIRALGPHLVHLHIEDIKNKEHNHLVPGEGDIDFIGVFAALKEVAYDGPCVVDLFRIQENPRGFAVRSFEAMRRLALA
ncbi:MAG: sugar phosphate isomerase/epimerase [Firmicutes bacterium]|nr:sugar phosphate isomerase/epimerase [Bacillota bacterium]